MAAVAPLPTRFAPAERAGPDELARQSLAAQGMEILQEVLSALPDLVLVLNRHRQVVYANRAALALVQGGEEALRGLRPGELLGCSHASETPGGCGTTDSCSVCGLVRAILSPAPEAEEEARMTLATGTVLDLRARTHRVLVSGEPLTVLALEDIADEKRRRALERIFFHDVLNTAGGVRGLADLVADVPDEQRAEILEMLRGAADQLLDEIQAQRILASAESRDYVVVLGRRSVGQTLREVVGTYRALARSRVVHLEADEDAGDLILETDHTLLVRVLGNLIKNALEASRAGDTVRAGVRRMGDAVRFHVHSAAALSPAVELQIFQRSFSTKGSDRGLGTYSVKLFTEGYLGGRVWFTSGLGEGTTFFVELPLNR